MYSLMSSWMSDFGIAEQCFGERFREQGLADTRRSEQRKGADGAASDLSDPRANGAALCTSAVTASFWPTTILRHFVFHGQELWRLRLVPCA